MNWSGVDYCDVFISCLDSYSDGTHSLQSIHSWASEEKLHFYKSDEDTNSSTLTFNSNISTQWNKKFESGLIQCSYFCSGHFCIKNENWVSFKGVIWCDFLFSFSLVCYVAVCACIISVEFQSPKSPTKGFILSKREGRSRPAKTHVYVTMWKYLHNPVQMFMWGKKTWFQ